MIDTFLKHLSVPKSCDLNKPVYKKYFVDSRMLNAADKKALQEDVGRIRWLYTLKPSTINISQYTDDDCDYPEVAILHVELSSPNRAKRIASFMQQSIPYPLVLLLTHEISLDISLAAKRTNQAAKDKWVVEDHYDTDWINLEQPTTPQADFLQDFKLLNFSYRNFFDFYQDIVQRIIALNCAVYTGKYFLDIQGTECGNNSLDALRELENLQQEQREIRNKLKKEKNVGTQVELNMHNKQITDRINAIKQEL